MNKRLLHIALTLATISGLLMVPTSSASAQDTAPVTVRFSAALPDAATETFTVNGTEYTVVLEGFWVVAGQATVLRKGDPVPAYDPSSDLAPLDLGEVSAEGYRVINLVDGGEVVSVDVPLGSVGPLYMNLTVADGPVNPEGVDEHPDLDGHFALIRGTMSVPPSFEKQVQLVFDAEQLVVLGAPGWEHTEAREFVVEFDLNGLFGDIDPADLMHSTNTIFLSDDENTAAYTTVSGKAVEAIATATH